MRHDAAELAHRLARDAEAVCRHYLSNGRREGGYWLVGDVRNTPGRSMFVRLKGAESGKGAAGKWTDASTGEHGDLLDVIRERCGLADFHDIADEARRFLSLPRPEPKPDPGRAQRSPSAPAGSPESARRLFAMSQPITGTIVEAYLRRRGITALHGTGSLRFHPRCYYRPDEHSPDRDLAGDDRFRHQPRRASNRRAQDLARSRRLQRGDARQGADRHATTGDGRPPRTCRSFRCGR